MHGTDVQIPWDGGALPAYAATPAGAERGAVVIHEILGRQPEIDRVVERFAARGYAAIAPDLFAGRSRLRCVAQMARAAATGDGPAARKAEAARRWLREATGLGGDRIGLIGFCLGGGFVLAVGRGWGAVSTNYGDVPRAPRLRGIGPVIGCYGARDRVFGRAAERLRAALADLGVDYEVHEFPAAGHSFLTDGDHPLLERLSRPLLRAGFEPAAAEEAWEKILAFFDRHLA